MSKDKGKDRGTITEGYQPKPITKGYKPNVQGGHQPEKNSAPPPNPPSKGSGGKK